MASRCTHHFLALLAVPAFAVAAGRWAGGAGDDIALPVGTMPMVDR